MLVGNVPVHRDAGEEEDGAVEVEVEEEANQAAHEVPEHPPIPQHVARHQERQRQTIHQVSGRQVHHVDQRGVPSTPAATSPAAAAVLVAAGSQQHHGVEREAKEEGQRVTDGQEDVFVGLVDAAGARNVRLTGWHVEVRSRDLAQSHDEGYFLKASPAVISMSGSCLVTDSSLSIYLCM